jgi:hypothetical protein
MTDDTLRDFVRAALNLRDAARYVLNEETFGQAELLAALAEFALADKALTDAMEGAEPVLGETTR